MSAPHSPQFIHSVHKVKTSELPLYCPTGADISATLHPKVYLKFDASNQAICPYCGTRYELTKD